MAAPLALARCIWAHHVFPKQSNDFIGKLAVKLGEWRGTSPVAQQILARQITDVTVMNIGGLANMGGQFALHRKGFDPKERSTVKSDFGRVITGRVAGTATAIGMVAIAKTLGPQAMKRSEQALSSLMGNSAKSDRFVELFISNAIQSVGGIAGNVPAQLLYDKLVDHGPSPQR